MICLHKQHHVDTFNAPSAAAHRSIPLLISNDVRTEREQCLATMKRVIHEEQLNNQFFSGVVAIRVLWHHGDTNQDITYDTGEGYIAARLLSDDEPGIGEVEWMDGHLRGRAADHGYVLGETYVFTSREMRE